MGAVQLGLFTGEPVAAEWQQGPNGQWWCARCLKVSPPGPKPRRRCPCGWTRKTSTP